MDLASVTRFLALLRTTVWSAPLIVSSTILMGALNMLLAPFDPDGTRQMWCARTWARMLVRLMGMRIRLTGLENLQPGKNYLFAGNHRSYADTPALLANLPGKFRIMAKAGLFQIPLLGHHLKTAGHIPVSSDNPREAVRSLNRAAEMIRDGQLSVLIFPEGGRTDGEMRPFKEGAALIAIRSGVELVPFGLKGTRPIMPMHHFTVRGGPVELHIGKPIPVTGLTTKDKSALTERLRNDVAALLGEEP